MKNLLKYTVFTLVVIAITFIFQLDGMTKTVVSKGLFIAFSIADKYVATDGELNWQKTTSKKLKKTFCKLPKYIGEGLV